MSSDGNHIFMGPFVICRLSSVIFLFIFFYFLIKLCVFILLSFKTSLHILEMNCLLDMSFAVFWGEKQWELFYFIFLDAKVSMFSFKELYSLEELDESTQSIPLHVMTKTSNNFATVQLLVHVKARWVRIYSRKKIVLNHSNASLWNLKNYILFLVCWLCPQNFSISNFFFILPKYAFDRNSVIQFPSSKSTILKGSIQINKVLHIVVGKPWMSFLGWKLEGSDFSQAAERHQPQTLLGSSTYLYPFGKSNLYPRVTTHNRKMGLIQFTHRTL